MSRFHALIAAALLILTGACQPAPDVVPDDAVNTGLRTIPLTIQTSSGNLPFTIELADTPREQEIGLMNRTSLPADRGMIFPHDPPRDARFWMKNTLIPLDLLFVGPDKRIIRIAHEAEPESLSPIRSGGTVISVIEIQGGLSRELGIDEGDGVVYSLP